MVNFRNFISFLTHSKKINQVGRLNGKNKKEKVKVFGKFNIVSFSKFDYLSDTF